LARLPFYNLNESHTIGEQTEEDGKTVSKGAQVGMGVNAPKDDVKLLIKRIKEMAFYTFCAQTGLLRAMIFTYYSWKKGSAKILIFSVTIEGEFVEANSVQCEFTQDLVFSFIVSLVFNFTLLESSTYKC